MSSSAAPAPPTVPAMPAAQTLSPGRIIGRSFSVWLRNFLPFSAVTVVLYLPLILLAALAPAVKGPGWTLLDLLLSNLAQLVVSGALTFGVLEALRGERASVGALLRTGFRTMGTVFVVSFRVGLWLLLGAILLVVPAILWYCALFVAVPAAVVEPGLGSSADALERSRALTRGSRWTILAVLLVTFLVTIGLVFASAALVPRASFLPRPVLLAAVATVTALASTFHACAAAVAYHELRVAKEGASTADLLKVFE